jgi:uncharacterized damage-inducible protein DinB
VDHRDTLLADFDHELAVTRRLIERIPRASLAWKPHDKSFSLGELATHLSKLPRWGAQILELASHDLMSGTNQATSLGTLDEILQNFDRNVADVRRGLVERSTAEIGEAWSLMRGRESLMTLPKGAAFRRFMLNHVIHHRGQLTVYLRLLDVPLPPIYGPTADERL